jgi:ribosome-associated heat shock protein Hsp15
MAKQQPGPAADGGKVRRVDQWLWFARVVKSRTLAAALVTGGKVRINRDRIDKPAHALKIGDVVTVTAHTRVRVLKVATFGDRRGPPAEAVLLYEDLTPPSAPRERQFLPAAAAQRDAGSGRPTKRDRRTLDRFQSSSDDDD